MRRYTLAIDGRTFTIDVAETGSDTFEVSVDGRTFEATLTGDHDLPGVAISPEVPIREGDPSGSRSAALNPTTRAARPAPTAEAAPGVAAAGGHATAVRPAAATNRPGPPLGRSEIVAAPMPGVVLAILVEVGATVERGAPLLVLEAMKMRNTIRAPRDGVVAVVAVTVGDHLASGAPMVRVVPPP